jgi:hypothetical protein
MQGSWIDFDKLWETVSQISECWKIYIKFRVFFLKKLWTVPISVMLRFVEDAWIAE